MYLIELIYRWIFPNKKYKPKNAFDPFGQDDIENFECEHVFLPVDSTGEILACTKCGFLVNKKDLKDKNIFRYNKFL